MRQRDRREGLCHMPDGLCRDTESSVRPRRRTGQRNT